MQHQLKIFGKLAEIVKSDNITLGEINDTAALQEELFKRYPAMKEMTFFIAVNNKLVKENTTIEAGAALALLPPFSGG